MSGYVIDAKPEHIKRVSSLMRQADIDEIWAAGRKKPENSLRLSLMLSKYAKTIMIDDKPIGMFGVTPLSVITGNGVPWLLGTSELENISIQFLKNCKKYVGEMCQNFYYLENYVDARNKVSIQWLKWLGFVILEPVPYGEFDLPFHKFYMENKNV